MLKIFFADQLVEAWIFLNFIFTHQLKSIEKKRLNMIWLNWISIEAFFLIRFLFKKGSPENTNCYRSISLLAPVAKFYEKIFASSMLEYFNTNVLTNTVFAQGTLARRLFNLTYTWSLEEVNRRKKHNIGCLHWFHKSLWSSESQTIAP